MRGMLKYRILAARLVAGFAMEKYTQYPAPAFLACSKFKSVGAAHYAFLSTNSNQLVLPVGGIVVAPSFLVSKIFENSKLRVSVNYPLGALYSLAGDLFGVRYNFFSGYISGMAGGLYFSRGLDVLESGNALSLGTNLICDLSLGLNTRVTLGEEFGGLSYDYLTEDYQRVC